MATAEQSSFPATDARADELVARMERVPVSRFHWTVAGTLGAGTYFDAFDIVSIGVILTAVSATFHLGPGAAGWLISAGFLGQALGAIGFGMLSERWGRRRVFLSALVVIGGFALLSVLSWSGVSLGTARFLQGLGLGAETPVASALLGELVRGRQRGRIAVLYKLASPLGNLSASLVAAALLASLAPELAWRLLFVVGAGPLLVAAAAWFLLPESPRYLVRRGRAEEAERVVRRMEDSARQPLEPAEPQAPPAPADVARTRFAELFSARYLRRTLPVWTLWIATYFILLGGTSWLPSQYVKVGHVSAARASLLAGSVQVVAIVLIVVSALVVDRIGRKWLLLGGYLVALAGGALGAVLWQAGRLDSWVPLYLAGTLLLLGVSVMDPLVYAYTAELYPTRMRSWGTMSSSAWRAIAAVIAPVVIGQILQAGLGIGAVFALFAVVLLAGLVIHAVWGLETKQAQLERLAR